MAYFDSSDTELDGDGINEAPGAGAYDVRGRCSGNDNECIWACPAEHCNRLYSAKRSGRSNSMTGTCFCRYRIQ